MSAAPIDQVTYQRLAQRVGRTHLNQRLGIETAYEAKIFGQGRTFFHIENLDSADSIIRGVLRATMMLGRGRRNARRVTVQNNVFRLPHLPPALDGYTLLHITDLHLDMAPDIPGALIEALDGLTYDACVMTGDYRANTYGPIDGAEEAMAEVLTHITAPVYGVLGNHDSIRMVPALEAAGMQLLLNEFTAIEHNGAKLYLAGIDDPHYFRADNIEKAADDIPPGQVSMLLSHSPEVYKNAAHAEFDMMLCGHTHGGQICLPGGRPVIVNARCRRDFCAGPWRYHGLHGYTSRGSGVSVVDVRFNCPAEIVLHRLVRA